MSNKEKKVLNLLIKNQNVEICINDTDKNLGAISVDKMDVISECHRQLYDIITFDKISWDEAKNLVDKLKFDLKNIVRKHMEKGSCSYQEAKFLLSKIESFSIPHFYIIWKILKKPMVGRPIVAGYNWILTPASIFVGTFLKDFYSKFDGILKDSLSLIKILEKSKFDINSFLFTVDFESLYTNIPVNDAIEMMKRLVFQFQNVISNAHFVIELLEIVLKKNLMTFDKEYFQQIFGIIMGTNLAPILANLYLAMLQEELKKKCANDQKLKWPKLF